MTIDGMMDKRKLSVQYIELDPLSRKTYQMELRHLRYFVAVAEELHFGRAAKRLRMTQPPLSQQIQQLERELGVVLLDRSMRAVALSAAGAWLLPEAKRVLAEAHALREGVERAASGHTGAIHLAFVSIADYAGLPELLRDFSRHYPGVRLTLSEATSDVQFEQLEAGRIDAGLLIPPIPPHLTDQLDYVALLRDPLVGALPNAQARRMGREKLDLARLKMLPLIIFPRHLAPGFYDLILGTFHAADFSPVIAQEAAQMQTIIALVAAGMGMALVPDSMRKLARAGVSYRALGGGAPEVEIGMASPARKKSPALDALLDRVRVLARGKGLRSK